MLKKKTEEMNCVLTEVQFLTKITEKHIIRLLDSCITFEQMQCLPVYVGQLYDNIKRISEHYKPCLWWRTMYKKEVDSTLLRSRGNVINKINEKFTEFSNYDQKRSN